VAPGEVLPRKAMLFRTKNQGHAPAVCQVSLHQRREIWQRNYRLLRLAPGETSSADDECATGNSFRKGRKFRSGHKQVRRTDSRPRFAPVVSIGGDNREPREPKVGHGARHRSYVERVAWRDKHYFNAVALGFDEQETIVERIMRVCGRRRCGEWPASSPSSMGFDGNRPGRFGV